MKLKTKRDINKKIRRWSNQTALKKGYSYKDAPRLFDAGAYQRHNNLSKYDIIKEYWTNKHYRLISNNGWSIIFDNTTAGDRFLISKLL